MYPLRIFVCALVFLLISARSALSQGYFTYDEKEAVDTVESYVADTSHFWVSINGGFGLAGMRGTEITELRSDNYTTSARAAPNGGINFGIRVHNALEIAIGVQYMTKGFKVARASSSQSETSDLGTVSYSMTHYQTLKADFIEIPLLLKPVRSYDFGQTNIHLFGGPTLGIPVSVKVESYVIQDRRNNDDRRAVTHIRTYRVTELIDGIPISDSTGSVKKFAFANVYRPYDLAILMGAGFERVANEHVGVFGEVRYTVSLFGFNNYNNEVKSRVTHALGEDAAYLNKRFHVLYACAGLRLYW